jgi:glycosyltransferase involved in cell wall biosynthesis
MMLRLIEIALVRGHPVCVICPAGDLARRLPADVEHVRIDELDLGGRSGLARLRAAFALLSRWRRTAATIREVVEPNSAIIVNSLMALPAARLARISGGVVWLMHDTIADSQQRLVIRFGRRSIRRAVAVSPATAESVRPLGIQPVVSPQGVDVRPMRADSAVADSPVVGIMGVLTPWKGHRVLLQALERLPQARCEVAGSAFYGDQSYADELQRLAMEPALAGRVEFLGHVDSVSTMQRWQALVSASTSPEAGPLVALEAMSVGVPVIGTDHGGCAWLLRDGAGILVPPDDSEALARAIETVLDGSADVAAMVTRARDRVVAEHDAAVTYPALLDTLLAAT